MIAVCLSDGMFPESSPKLKQVLRRTLKIAKQSFFPNEGMLIFRLIIILKKVVGLMIKIFI
jgi:hypothetical protein